LRVADEIQGKKVRCPGCRELVVANPAVLAGKAALPKGPPSTSQEGKRRPAAPAARAAEDEPPRQPQRRDEEDAAPAARQGKPRARSGGKTWLWVGVGVGAVLLLAVAGLVTLGIVFGKPSPAEQLAGSWELDRESGAPIPDQFKDYKTFGYQFDREGTWTEDWNGSIHQGKWRAEAGDANDPLFALVSYPPRPWETIFKFRPVDNDHLLFNHSGVLVPLRRSNRQLATRKEETPPAGDAGKAGAEKGKVLALLKEHTMDVTSLSFADGNTLATASWDGTVKVWDLAAGKSKYTLRGHTGQARAVAFFPGGKVLASAGGNPDPAAKGGEVKLWDLDTGNEKATLVKGERPVEAVVVGRSGRMMGWSDFAAVVLWDVPGNKQKATLADHSWEVTALALTDNGRILAVAGGQEVKLWEPPPATGKSAGNPPKEKKSVKAKGLLSCVALSADGRLVAAGGDDGTVTVWEVDSGAEKLTLKAKDNGQVRGLAFAPEGRVLVGACSTVQFWDLNTGTDLGAWESALQESHYPVSVAFSPDGKKMVTGSHTGSLKVWDAGSLPAPKR
jgi:WD40 repeat protein